MTEPTVAKSDAALIRPSAVWCRFALLLVFLLCDFRIALADPTFSVEGPSLAPFGTPDSQPQGFTRVDETVYFFADDGTHGWEIWRTDGSPDGTRLAVDVNPGPASFNAGAMCGFRGRLYFNGFDADGRKGLWQTDGTPSGTHLIWASSASPWTGTLGPLAPAGDWLYFLGSDPESGEELWITDGTAEGTRRVADVVAGPNSSLPEHLSPLGHRLFFSASNAATSTAALYVTDGTANGTRRLTDFSPRAMGSTSGAQFSRIGEVVLFGSSNPSGLWCSDGTPEGTRLLQEFQSYSLTGVSSSEIDGRPQYFFSASDTEHGQELWVSDGTEAGTRLFADAIPGPDWSNATPVFARDGRVYFWVTDADGAQWLWSSDGTPDGTRRFGSISRGRHNSVESTFAHAGQWTFFHAGGGPVDQSVWATDGTEGNTRPLIESIGDVFGESPMMSVGDAVLMGFHASVHGRELWLTDGTPNGTRLLKDINRYQESWEPAAPVSLGDKLLFAAEAPGLGRELFVSDGTSAGTSLLVDAHPGPIGGGITDLVATGNTAYFLAKRDGPNRSSTLYLTDGTPAGTRVVVPMVNGGFPISRQSLAVEGTKLLFSAVGTGSGASNAWILDSPSSPPRQLTGLDNAWPGQASVESEFLTVQDGFFFTARATFADYELWRSDGTVAGTRLVADLWPGRSGSRPRNLRTDGALVYFFAHSPAGSGLHCSDGTAAGTRFLAPMWILSAPEPVKTLAGSRTFFVGIDKSHGSELWITDGRPEGTRRLLDLTPGPASTSFGGLKAAGPLLYFTCTTPGVGTELWRSDGTEAGTFLLRDIASGEASSRPANIYFHLGHCFFSAWDPEHGRELWSTDGTPAGTALVEDVQPGAIWSQPIGLTTLGDRLAYFESADTLAQARLRLLPSAEVTAVASNSQEGRVTGAGRFSLGVRVPVTAHSNAGFTFSHWEGGEVIDAQSESTHLRLIADTQVTAVFRPVPSLVEWLRAFGLDGAAALDPMAELTGDGHPNFIKYAFGLDPTVPHGTSAAGETESPLPSLFNLESGRIRLSHLRRRNALLRYEVQVSSTLRAWEPITAAVQSVVVLSSQWERVTYQLDQASVSDPTTLLRVKIEATGP